jgi:putative hydrolase of the HAD superfamily
MRDIALIFDFGNVVAFFDFARAYNHFAWRVGLDERTLRTRVEQPAGRELFRQFECGQIAPEEFSRALMSVAEIDLPYHEFVRGWVEIFWPNETVGRLVASLRGRVRRLLLGSNTNVLHAEHFRRQFASTLAQFDSLILSHEVGSMKPDRRFYDACVRAAGLPASSCMFIDDMDENVQGARQAGLVGVRYTDTPRLLDALRASGVDLSTDGT